MEGQIGGNGEDDERERRYEKLKEGRERSGWEERMGGE